MRNLFLLLSASGAVLLAQSKTVVDNDQVRVLLVTQQPHQKTRLHDHKVNRVMIYLQPGKQEFEYPETKKKSILTWKAGEAKWSPAAGMHTAEIVSDNPVTIVEVELKKPGDPSKKATGSLDPVKVDPKEYKVVFENDQVRVLYVKIGPSQTTPVHEHTLNRVVTYLSDQKIKVTTPDGKSNIVERKAGEVGFSGPAKHKEENLNSTPFEVMVVELRS
jgi:predicted metal-dependent enzyme (double-stranded beta helix superfamily)